MANGQARSGLTSRVYSASHRGVRFQVVTPLYNLLGQA